MFHFRFRAIILTTLIAIFSPQCFAGDKEVKFETIPSGAQVELDGSIVCTTPCSIHLPSYYFKFKISAFSKHSKAPLSVRFLKQSCAPKTVTITEGPITFVNGYQIPIYKYYIVASAEFKVKLDAPNDISESATSASSAAERSVTAACRDTSASAKDTILQSARGAIVSIPTPKGWGTGFFVSSDGLLITNAYVGGNHKFVTMYLPDGKSVEVSTFFVDDGHDLAVVRVPGNGYPYLKLSRNTPDPGADVFAISSQGSGPARTNAVTEATVGSVFSGHPGTWIQTGVPFDHENSGGPVLDRDGVVVGVNTLNNPLEMAEIHGLNYSVASSEVERFVRSHFGVDWRGGDAK